MIYTAGAVMIQEPNVVRSKNQFRRNCISSNPLGFVYHNKFKSEAIRILRNGGKVAIVWNTSLESDFTVARDTICKKYCPRFRAGYAGKRSPAEGDEFLRHHYFRRVEVVSFDNPFAMDKETFEGNMRSRSYFLAPNEPNYQKITAELNLVFERYSVNGLVVEPQETQIFLGEF